MAQLTLCTAFERSIQFDSSVIGVASNGGQIELETAADHNLASGDIVSPYAVGGVPAASGIWVATVVDPTHVVLNGSTAGGSYTGGGTIQHVGFVAGAQVVDQTVFPNGTPDFQLIVRAEYLSWNSTARFIFSDALDSAYSTELPLAMASCVGTGNAGGELSILACKRETVPDATRTFGQMNGRIRLKVIMNSGPGSTVQLSSWITF